MAYDHSFDHLRGKRVRIPLGAPLHGTQPGALPAHTRRSIVVRVDHVLSGSEGWVGHDGQAEVRWAGSGGYWRSVPARLVTLVED